VPKRILIAEDEDSVRNAMCAFIKRRSPYEVWEAADGDEATKKAYALKPDLVVLDLRMPIAGGIEVAARLQTIMPKTPVVIFTMFENLLGRPLAKMLGVAAVVPKTDGVGSLLGRIEALLNAQDALRDSDSARLLPNPIPGERQFCVCRVRVGCALTTIESFATLAAAETFMNDIVANAGFLHRLQSNDKTGSC